jgi:beta-lactamase class A
MQRRLAWAAFATILAAPLVVRAGELPVRADVERLIVRSGADVAVAFRTLDGREELLIHPDVSFHAASTVKVPVMIELFRQSQAGLLKLDDRIPMTNTFRSVVDGSAYVLNPADDSDTGMRHRLGQQVTYRELCEAMITASSNLAANILIERLDARKIQETNDMLGAVGMRILRGVEDGKAIQQGVNNTTTARALLTLMEKIALGQAIDESASSEMVATLKRQKMNDRIPAGVPPGIAVAHKTGEIKRIQHDAAIVFASRPFVLVILVRGLEDAKKGSALAAGLTRILYAASQAPPMAGRL